MQEGAKKNRNRVLSKKSATRTENVVKLPGGYYRRVLKVVALNEYGKKFCSLLDSEDMPNILSLTWPRNYLCL